MSKLESQLEFQIKVSKLQKPEREYRFHPERRWRFDFAYPDLMIAIEVEGGVWQAGRHNRAKGFIADCDKYNQAVLLGWRVLRFTSQHIADGTAIRDIEQILEIIGIKE